MTRTTRVLSVLSAASCLVMIAASAGADLGKDTSAPPLLGQVRMMAVESGNQAELASLRQEGWMEATGQLVSTKDLAALYQVIGRTWTSSRAPADEFALPDLNRALAPNGAASNPYGVLGPGDLVRGGERRPAAAAPSVRYFIYVGRSL